MWRPTRVASRWFLAALGVVFLPHAMNLQIWVIGCVAAAGAWCGLTLLLEWRRPPAWLRMLLAVGAAAAVFLQFGTLLGRDAGVTLLVLMMALKLLEMNGLRDGMVVLFLCYFLIITQFLFSQSIPMVAYLFASAWVVTAALVALNRRSGAGDDVYLPGRVAGTLMVQALPIMALLFVLFPRLPGPVWNLPTDTTKGLTGLSDSMRPGSISELTQSDAVAFRVKFEGQAPSREHLYWRGPVFWSFDGVTWSPGDASEAIGARLEPRGDPLRYSVMLEPHGQRWLFALDLATDRPPRTFQAADFRLLNRRPVMDRIQYAVTSHVDYTADPRLRGYQRRAALALPVAGNPAARRLARELREQASSDAGFVAAVLDYFRAQPFTYTMTPPLVPDDPVDGFLFETRKGFCEHYASAFTYLMRAGGVPARVVTGYLGGEENLLGGYHIVRQSDAHAWSEVWLPKRGWVRVDATSVIAPGRVSTGVEAALGAGEPLPLMRRTEQVWLRQLRLVWDTVNNHWNQWVLGYGAELQTEFLGWLGLGAVGWMARAFLLVGLAGAIVFLVTLWRTGHRHESDPLDRIYARFCEKLARAGLPKQPAEGPIAYAERVAGARPEIGPRVKLISELYTRMRYGGRDRSTWLEPLRRHVTGFKPDRKASVSS